MITRVRILAWVAVLAVAVIGAGSRAFAHEVTYKGTVLTLQPATLRVSVIDDTTKKTTPMDFAVTAKTKVFRGDKAVPFAQAHIQKGERVAVTINHDVPGQQATEIRLAAIK